MLDAIRTHLEGIALRERQMRFWTAFGLGLAAACVSALAAWYMRTALSAWVAFAAPVGFLLAGLIAGALASRRRTDLRSIAVRVERAHPELNGRLLTTLDFEARAERDYLEARVAEETLAHAAVKPWVEVVPAQRLAWVQLGNLGAVALLAVLLVNLWPLRIAQKPHGEFWADHVTIEPGDVLLERGSSLTVLAKFPERELPSTVELVIETSAGQSNRITLGKTLKDPVFGVTLPTVETNFTYRIEYGGEQSRDFRVEVYEHPKLERANAEVVYPEYTGVGTKRIENTRRVSAVEGSVVGLELLLNKPVRQAELIGKDGQSGPVALLVSSNQPVARLADLRLMTNQSYLLRLVDVDGRTNKLAEQFVMEALQNRTPELRMSLPRGDLRASALEEIQFAGTVWDDFGVEAYGIAYGVVGRDLEFVELGQKVGTPEKRAFEHLLKMEDLGVTPDQLISYFVWADDIGPDGELRRFTGDLFFAEIRPFEERFREAGGGQQGGGAGGGGGGGGQEGGPERLAEVQKQIINATWNLQRSKAGRPPAKTATKPDTQSAIGQELWRRYMAGHGRHRPANIFAQSQRGNSRSGSRQAGGAPVVQDFSGDLGTVREAQEKLLSQAQSALERTEDPRTATLLRNVVTTMTRAGDALRDAEKSPERLAEALAAQQSAYEAILKLQEHEYQVSRGQRGSQGQSGGGRQQQMQMQLDQMELTQSENRYETQREAERPTTVEQKEDLVTMNRLEELARRQQDLNQQFQELQLELQQARTEEQRAELLRRLKKLQEEQEQMLNNMDELRQLMERPENQSRMSEQRQQLEQAREDARRAAEAASQGSPSQALAAGTRAQRQLQEARDEMRNANSSQFADDMRELRDEARELARNQEELVRRMAQDEPAARRSLSAAPDREELLEQLARQRERLTNLVSQAMETSQDAETSEPLLSESLYDAARKFSQDSARETQAAQNELLNRGMMTRSLLDQLRDPKTDPGGKLLDIASEMLRQDFGPAARDAAQRGKRVIEEFSRGIEQAADSILGSDTEALKIAEAELDDLSRQLERELAAQSGAGGTNQNVSVAEAGGLTNGINQAGGAAQENGTQGEGQGQTGTNAPNAEVASNGSEAGEGAGERRGSQGRDGQRGSGQPEGEAGQEVAGAARGETPSEGEAGQGAGAQPGQGQRTGGQTAGNGRRGNQGGLQGGSPRSGGGEGGDLSGSLGGSWDRLLQDQAGPLTGDDFAGWSERLSDVEQMIDVPELRNEVALARERAREIRQDFKRDRKKPDWAVVRLQLLEPLAEVRKGILEELARRAPRENLVPIDRDPVPSRYGELVRRYYENLGKESPAQ